jgi:cell division protease FtsH
MDGFDSKTGVVIMAATNRPESLDPALLRPGRFDRRIPMQLPDLKGRQDILQVHAKSVKMAPGIDFEAIARATSGASGAELANIVNEAALRAVRVGHVRVEQVDLQESVEVVIAGHQRKNAVLTPNEKRMVAYHEVGHALVAARQSGSAPVTKITIIPRTSGALGYTMQVEDEERYLMTKEELEQRITTLTGGRAAEELIFGVSTTGASNDIEKATQLARSMVTTYGMTNEFGMFKLDQQTNQYLGAETTMNCSAEIANKADNLAISIVKQAKTRADNILAENIDKLHEISAYLIEKETITGQEFMQILNN